MRPQRDDLPGALEAVVMRALQPAPADRYPDTAALRDALAEAIPYVHELIDLAIGTMNTAYASNANRMARSDEAYRLFFLSQNMKAERERRAVITEADGEKRVPGVAPNNLTSADWRDTFAGTPWHKHVPARIEALTA